MMVRSLVLLVAYLACQSISAFAGEADVDKVDVTVTGQGGYNFAVTISHQDTGWEHYADRWEIVDINGSVLGTRVLHHPHVNEQPFTRSLSGVEIPEHLNKVTVRAHDSVHGFAGKVVSVDFPGRN